MPSKTKTDWQDAKRQASHYAIVGAAWRLVRAEGLAGLSLRALAAEAGITTPTVYAYFESKDAIYDALFQQAASDFADQMAEPYRTSDPREVLTEELRRFMEFCTSDPQRYQLLFQRTIPGFEPTATAYAPAVRALETTRGRLADIGIDDPRHLDLWTALSNGLADQQIANDPGGSRWIDLVSDAVDMFLDHCQNAHRAAKRRT